MSTLMWLRFGRKTITIPSSEKEISFQRKNHTPINHTTNAYTRMLIEEKKVPTNENKYARSNEMRGCVFVRQHFVIVRWLVEHVAVNNMHTERHRRIDIDWLANLHFFLLLHSYLWLFIYITYNYIAIHGPLEYSTCYTCWRLVKCLFV